MRAAAAVHAVAFPLVMRAGAAVRAVASQLPVRAADAGRAVASQLAMRAGVAVRAVLFPPTMRTSVAVFAALLQLPVRARVAVRAVVFHPAMRARVAHFAVCFLPTMLTPLVLPHRALAAPRARRGMPPRSRPRRCRGFSAAPRTEKTCVAFSSNGSPSLRSLIQEKRLLGSSARAPPHRDDASAVPSDASAISSTRFSHPRRTHRHVGRPRRRRAG